MDIAICDDDVVFQDRIQTLLETFRINEDITIHSFESGEELITSISNGNSYHLLFMDIRMKKLDGIETTKLIRRNNKSIYIIFTTYLIEYAAHGYSLCVNDFLLKPISHEQFSKVFDRFLRTYKQKQKNFYLIQNKEEKIMIHINDILYFESFGRKVSIHTKAGIIEQYQAIKNIEKKLEVVGFVRTHRSYLVNMKYINSINSLFVKLRNEEVIPLSSKKYKDIYDKFTLFHLNQNL